MAQSNPNPQSSPKKDYLWLHLRELPYFRAMLRAVEAEFYQDYDLPTPTLDLGCGDGHFATIAFNCKLEVGLDPWESPLHEAKKRRKYKHLILANGARMPFNEGHFASAVSNSVLEHIPHVDHVLAETARVLRPHAPFLFCVPNPGYLTHLSISAALRRIGLKKLAAAYTEWFRRMSNTHHSDPPEIWQARLEQAGFIIEKWWHYFSPQALHMLEWGHYFGSPTLLTHTLFKRWIIAPWRWNLFLTEGLVRKYAVSVPDERGTYTFYVARRI
jgi:SAM-dependent methyltransferase